MYTQLLMGLYFRRESKLYPSLKRNTTLAVTLDVQYFIVVTIL